MTREAGASLLVAGVSLVWLAASIWSHWFVCDDAYISFRYARNLIEGHGLVFNPGEWVEGYTNFLWVLEVSLLWLTGLDPADSSCLLSILATAGTVLTVAWWSRTSQSPAFVLAVALLLLGTERSFAVWATSGLETRQFTLLVAVGCALASQPGRRASLVVSTVLGLAALTRPEGMLVAGVIVMARVLDDRRELWASAGPLAALVGGHLALRLYLYGEYVPNTYIAKHVGPWPEMGLRYLFAAAVESGLFLLVPLAAIGFAARFWTTRRWAELAAPTAIAAEAFFLARIGGDHFEWRPLDWWWPLLFLGAAEALARLRPSFSLPLLAVVLLYGRVPELAHDRLVDGRIARGERVHDHVELTPQDVPLPGMTPLLERYNRDMVELVLHLVAVRHHKHRAFAELRMREFRRYLPARDELHLPADAVDMRTSVGIAPFHLPDLVVVDRVGLTDATVARNPVPAGWDRRMAHDRRPPRGYPEQRGVNFLAGPVARSVRRALSDQTHAVPVREYLVLAFDTYGLAGDAWAERAFAGRAMSWRASHEQPHKNLLVLEGQRWRGVRVLGSFEQDLSGWTATGEAWTPTPPSPYDAEREVGLGYATSQHPTLRDAPTGLLSSPPFRIEPDQALSLMVAGGDRSVGVRLVVDGQTAMSWSGERDHVLRYRYLELAPWAGRTAWVELFDESDGPWGHVVADHIVLLEL